MISGFIPLWLENMFVVILFYWTWLGLDSFDLLPVGRVFCKYLLGSLDLTPQALLRSSFSLLIFCLDMLCIIENKVLDSATTSVLLFLSSFW